jgi:hypothetical protein
LVLLYKQPKRLIVIIEPSINTILFRNPTQKRKTNLERSRVSQVRCIYPFSALSITACLLVDGGFSPYYLLTAVKPRGERAQIRQNGGAFLRSLAEGLILSRI